MTQLSDTLGRNGIHDRVVRRKLLLTQKNIKAYLDSATTHLDEPKTF